MIRAPAIEAPSPLIEMNTTPLIDVMLVLLVMLIITVPPQSHAVNFDLPNGPTPPLPIHKVNLLRIDSRGALTWNGAPIGGLALQQELAAARQMEPSPELHLRPDADARHGDVDQLLATIKREQISRFGFVGNEAYQSVF